MTSAQTLTWLLSNQEPGAEGGGGALNRQLTAGTLPAHLLSPYFTYANSGEPEIEDGWSYRQMMVERSGVVIRAALRLSAKDYQHLCLIRIDSATLFVYSQGTTDVKFLCPKEYTRCFFAVNKAQAEKVTRLCPDVAVISTTPKYVAEELIERIKE